MKKFLISTIAILAFFCISNATKTAHVETMAAQIEGISEAKEPCVKVYIDLSTNTIYIVQVPCPNDEEEEVEVE